MFRVGFTGTSNGFCNDIQKGIFQNTLFFYGSVKDPSQFIHGDCIGADAEAHDLAVSLGYQIRIFPPTNMKARAFKHADILEEEHPYLTRNKLIVDNCDILLAVPGGPETLRSGTWSTVRYAKRKDKKIVIFYPDGVTEYHNINEN